METPKIFESEYRFCLILWEHEPVKSGDLVHLCRKQLGWKPTTTYTVIKRLSERGVLKNENSIVSALVTKDEVQLAELEEAWHRCNPDSFNAWLSWKRQYEQDKKDPYPIVPTKEILSFWSWDRVKTALGKEKNHA